MIKRIRAKHPLGYCVLAEVLFLAGMMVFTFAALLAAGLMGLDWILADEFLTTILQEIFGVGIGLLLLWRSGKQNLLWRRGSGFLDGMPVGIQFTGRHFDEKTILQVSYALEKELGLKSVRPALLERK